jgi:hypothetical protein
MWKYKTAFFTDNYDVYKYAILKYVKLKKYDFAIIVFQKFIYTKEFKNIIEPDFVYEILYALPNENKIKDEHKIFEVLKILQINEFDKDKTIEIELKYCDKARNSHSPIWTLCFSEKCIAEPEYFINYLKNINTIYYWNKVYIFDYFTAEISNPNEWINAIYDLMKDKNDDFKNLVYYCIGKIFNRQISYDKEGIIQIPDEIANILEQDINILRDFSVNLFNSQGAYFVDAAETIANKFNQPQKHN